MLQSRVEIGSITVCSIGPVLFPLFQLTKKMRATLSKTKFKEAPIVPVAAKPGNSTEEKASEPIGKTGSAPSGQSYKIFSHLNSPQA